jgi:prefoldin subunit 5
LKRSQDELRSVEENLNGKKRIIEDQRARVTQAINAQIEAAQTEHAALTVRIDKARQAIKDIDASRESLIRRLRI